MLKIVSIHTKPDPGALMQIALNAEALAGVGLKGDCNADPSSPRQVLLVDRRSLTELKLRDADLRANLVVDGELTGLESGTIVTFGDVSLRITIPCEPCGKLNLVRAGLSQRIGAKRGLLARVLSAGELRVGAKGRVSKFGTQSLAPNWKLRVKDIIKQVPKGKVITYGDLATVAGVQTAYCRAIPAVLRSIRDLDIPVHRVVPSDWKKIDAGQMRWLASEGADLSETRSYWNNALYYASQEVSDEGHRRERQLSLPL
jgi:alkylated DNA nucleotide flippase Atl1